ncbi:hypothetical protein FEM48_Zijuj04G0081500 [Ziziphus jujuba var. spinosa]|uniref:Uncharacterized protein n=1 Tax=Ziziphus jujuba var. spinosa TaxID=714518 RepID=A0A978VIR6_ZIZJJ|nr:hypothetical protein FEM48_Zijuj04G0081500 [Ziziphus jujuba var. spinosa]
MKYKGLVLSTAWPPHKLLIQSNNNPITRKSANYKPTIWTYDFVQSLKGHDMDELLMYRANKLEEQVKSMISNEKTEFLTKLELIDDIQRLGLAYHFEQDIKKALHRCAFLVDKIERTEKNLHATALSFRLLRQHGFEVSQDESENNLSKQVSHALELPLHHRMLRLEARWYIEEYSKRSDANQVLLEAAKLDFNRVQSVLQRDLKDMSRWDVSAVNILPDYMKLCFLALYNTVNEMVYDILKEQGLNILPYLTKAWADLFKAFLKEAKWCHRKYTPTFEEYFDNAWMSISGVAILVHAYLLVDKSITKECLDCLENHHNLLRWPSIIFRLCNDLGTSSVP